MDRRHFLKALGAIAAGVGLRAVPVLGETYSELVPPKFYTGGFVAAPASVSTIAHWLPATNEALTDGPMLRNLIERNLVILDRIPRLPINTSLDRVEHVYESEWSI
jgi:hypothetical protein